MLYVMSLYSSHHEVTMSTTLKDVDSAKFIAAYAAHLKRAGWLKLPAWTDFVKTGHFKEMPPMNEDWCVSHTIHAMSNSTSSC